MSAATATKSIDRTPPQLVRQHASRRSVATVCATRVVGRSSDRSMGLVKNAAQGHASAGRLSPVKTASRVARFLWPKRGVQVSPMDTTAPALLAAFRAYHTARSASERDRALQSATIALMPQIKKSVGRYHGYDPADLIQAGRLAVWQVLERADPAKGDLLHLAAVMIARRIADWAGRDGGGPIRFPVSAYQRGERRAQVQPLTWQDDSDEALDVPDSADVEALGVASAAKREFWEIMGEAVAETLTTERQRHTFLLRHRENLEIAQVAQAMGISGKAADNAIQLAQRNLRTKLGSDDSRREALLALAGA